MFFCFQFFRFLSTISWIWKCCFIYYNFFRRVLNEKWTELSDFVGYCGVLLGFGYARSLRPWKTAKSGLCTNLEMFLGVNFVVRMWVWWIVWWLLFRKFSSNLPTFNPSFKISFTHIIQPAKIPNQTKKFAQLDSLGWIII